ncbi:MAG: hypothetical protein ACYC7I_12950 [Gammaproteobacteria bacterium]
MGILLAPVGTTDAQDTQIHRECWGKAQLRRDEPLTKEELSRQTPAKIIGGKSYYSRSPDPITERNAACFLERGYQLIYVRETWFEPSDCEYWQMYLEAGAERARVEWWCRQKSTEAECVRCLGDKPK